MFFKKKVDAEAIRKSRKLSDVIDGHLTSYIRVVNINNSLKTGLMIFAICSVIFSFVLDSIEVKQDDHIALIDFSGTMDASNRLANADGFADAFKKATEEPTAKVILIAANSGGGSPIQGESINQIIHSYTQKPLAERKKVIVAVQEVCASACVMGLSGVDEINVHANSLIGSISVRMDGWAIDKALSHFDVERKVITTGQYKALFDPYRNLQAEERDFIKDNVMAPMHQSFVNIVKEARGDKLDLSNKMLFEGMVWTGYDGVQVGLADKVETMYQVQTRLKDEYNVTAVKQYNKASFSMKNLLTSSFQDAIQAELSQMALPQM